jgi:hypothetical protein
MSGFNSFAQYEPAAPNIAGAGNYAQMLFNLLNPNQKNGQQQNGQQQGQQNQGQNSLASQLQNLLNGTNPNWLAPGGQFSPADSYINDSGDLMSAGQITPG